MHYQASEGSALLKKLDRTTPVLIDSGGQYDYGTTDVTRTWYFGDDAEAEFRDVYTRVLKGNIGVDTTVFPGEHAVNFMEVYITCLTSLIHGTDGLILVGIIAID